MSDDDITSEWTTIKAVPKAKGETPDVDLRMDILDARSVHPEFIYRVHEGFGVDSMALVKSRCWARRHVKDGWCGQRGIKDIYIYTPVEVLYAGSKYTHKAEEFNRKFSSPCKSFVETIDEALTQLRMYRDRHVDRMMDEVKRFRAEAQQRLDWATEREIAAVTARVMVFKIKS